MIQRLTTRQIAEFNDPAAFARDRVQRIGQSVLGQRRNSTIRTQNIEESFRLVTGALTRLETLQGNLTTLLDINRQAARASARGNTRQLEEAYGKMRSLSAGFDQVVDAVKFSGNTVFANNSLVLNMGQGARPLKLDAPNLRTFGENSLGLSVAEAGAEISVRYQVEDLIVNSGNQLVGLDIDSASFIQGSNPALELETGNYKVHIAYAGAKSTVEIRSTTGALLEAKNDVDLSGSGRRWVDFDNGVRLTFALEQILQGIDKYDYENLGPARLQASMSYRRIDAHVLRTQEQTLNDGVHVTANSRLDMGASSMALTDARLSPINTTVFGLDNGNYTVEVEHLGENSVVRLLDRFGRMRGFQFGVDLREEGDKRIDLGVGLSFNINVGGTPPPGTKLIVPITYQRAKPPIEEFDFREYGKRIEAAIAMIGEQLEIFDRAKEDIEEFNQLRASAATSGVPDANSFLRNSAFSLLGGGPKGGLFRPKTGNDRFRALTNDLFTATTALPSQANITPRSLNSARIASASGWLGNFS